MKTFVRLAASLCICAIASQASARSQPACENIARDTPALTNSSYATEEMRQAYRFYVSAAGSETQAGEILGQAAFDVDDFKGTRLGGWWAGYEHAPLWGAVSGIVNYTSYWYFLNLARDGNSHGSSHGGCDYRYHKVDGGIADVDQCAMVYPYSRELKRENFDIIEAHYRQDTHLDWQEHYGDFQTAVFQPTDNLATYWFEQFRAAPLLQTIGYALHAIGDMTQPHHVWVTSANGHSSWEGWVDDHYAGEKLNDLAVVANLVGCYDPSKSTRDLPAQIGQIACARPELLYDISYETHLRVAKELIPESIALTVIVLTKGVNSFDAQTAF